MKTCYSFGKPPFNHLLSTLHTSTWIITEPRRICPRLYLLHFLYKRIFNSSSTLNPKIYHCIPREQ